MRSSPLTRRPVAVSLLVAASLLALACSGGDREAGDDAGPTTTAQPTPEPDPSPTADATATPEPTVPTVTRGPAATPTPVATPTPEPVPTATPGLPGEPFDFLVPANGEFVGVIGVAYDDILEVHELPGENTPVVGELPNQAETVIGTGEGRLLPASIWWRIRYEGIEGWAGSGFLARIGATFDITADVVASAGGELEAETMLDLGMMVADLRRSDDPPSRVVVSGEPSVNADQFGEIIMDVVGLGDDALRGERLYVFGDGADLEGEGFGLSNVEMTVLCARGVTTDGLCV